MKDNAMILRAIRRSAIIAGAGLILWMAGCAGNSKGTLGLDDRGRVQGRDLGRGGATAGGLSSVDPHGNAADYSVYDARQIQQEDQAAARN